MKCEPISSKNTGSVSAPASSGGISSATRAVSLSNCQTAGNSGSLARLPLGWSFTDAATIPTAFFTAYYALEHLARVEAGETILIHGAAGGVGIAAIQLAHVFDLNIIATAGTKEKRDFLHMMGVEYVFDSRKNNYADEILEITQGSGVDIVLNSLAGEAIDLNLSVLKPFGRFLELGKRDFFENSKIGLRPFRNNISYFGIDADQLMVERPKLTETLFKKVISLKVLIVPFERWTINIAVST